MMTKEELLRPRYKVIADYPNSLYNIGHIIHESENFEGKKFFEQTVHKYPHIFKMLEWWENRKLEDMPKYVKSGGGNHIGEVIKWDLNNQQGWICTVGGYCWHRTKITPATEQEYNDYLKKSK